MFRIIHMCDISWKVEERYMVAFLYDLETASRETDFTFLWNKAYKREMYSLSPIFTYRRLLGHKIFHLFMKYFSVMYSCGSSSQTKTKCCANCITKLLLRDAYVSLLWHQPVQQVYIHSCTLFIS